MIITENAYTAIKTATYLFKRGGISNVLVIGQSINVPLDELLPILNRLEQNKIVCIGSQQPYPIIKLINKRVTAYQVVAAALEIEIVSTSQLIESFLVTRPHYGSRWTGVYNCIQKYEGRTNKELNMLMISELARLYHLHI